MLLAVVLILLLTGCSGTMIAQAMPGEAVTIEGNTFVVNDAPGGMTVRNFETGFTDPVLLVRQAGLAAERATGCSADSVSKDARANTYAVALVC